MATRVFENSWKWRRLAVFATLKGCAFGMGYIIAVGDDSALYRDAFSTLALLFGTTLMGYLGWATYDDKNVVKQLGREAFGAGGKP